MPVKATAIRPRERAARLPLASIAIIFRELFNGPHYACRGDNDFVTTAEDFRGFLLFGNHSFFSAFLREYQLPIL